MDTKIKRLNEKKYEWQFQCNSQWMILHLCLWTMVKEQHDPTELSVMWEMFFLGCPQIESLKCTCETEEPNFQFP